MFSNKENINMLTSLLVAHGICHVVVCPGSRNAPLIHNFNECGGMQCHPVTDERSAGFYALGMAQASGRPVAVCVTSGTALLNLAPAVAEAFYQKLPLVVVSADRPGAFIGQLDGQTMPQDNALGCFSRKSVNIPEPDDDTCRWHNNRLINEALLECVCNGGGPVHINVPLSEPLFNFTVPSLPAERVIRKIEAKTDTSLLSETLCQAFLTADKPMIVIGQMKPGRMPHDVVGTLSRRAVIISEPLAHTSHIIHFDEVISSLKDTQDYLPDFILYIGGTLVSKRLKAFLRKASDADVWRIDDDGDIHDTFMNLKTVVQGRHEDVLALLADACRDVQGSGYAELWNRLSGAVAQCAADYEPLFSQMAVVKYFEEQLGDMDYDHDVYYANSSSVRLANIYADHHVYCNRGVNGIEGCLSVAAGHSVVCQGKVFCVIGDLSFMYDQNALWNVCLHGNLRVILLNNGCGGIFYGLKGLEDSPSMDTMVAGRHTVSAQGICAQNDIGYMKATNMQEMQIGMVTLLTAETSRPMVLEVFTDAVEDKKALDEYYRKAAEAVQEYSAAR